MADSERIIDERRDWYVAQLYNFMDDRGTPINRAPTLASSDVDLFHLHRLVASMGGYNKVCGFSFRWLSHSFIDVFFTLSGHLVTNTQHDYYNKRYCAVCF